nr:immunoglobulin light chain junction region [Macaca mulatta]
CQSNDSSLSAQFF